MIDRKLWARRIDPDQFTGHGLSIFNKLSVIAIIISSLIGIIQTEPTLSNSLKTTLDNIQVFFLLCFIAEFSLRIWVSAENSKFSNRFQYLIHPASILDITAIIILIFISYGSEAFILRALRLVRILMLARLTKFASALLLIVKAVHERRYELFISACMSLIFLTLTATALFLIEGPNQPDTFGSIPRAMWWSISTFTPIGSGEAQPITMTGKVLSGIAAISGVGLVAMPAGILAAAFSKVISDVNSGGSKRNS